MSSFSRARALLQSAEEMATLIVELHDLRMQVQRAEATALASGHVAARKSRGAAAVTRRAVAAKIRSRRVALNACRRDPHTHASHKPQAAPSATGWQNFGSTPPPALNPLSYS